MCGLAAWALVVLWLLAGCTEPTEAEQADQVRGADAAALPADVAATEATTGAASPDDRSVPRASAEPGPAGMAATRSAASVPFGDTDLFLGARDEPGAVVVWTEPQDAPGALWEPGYIAERSDVSGRLLDLCVREEANAAVTGQLLGPGEPMGHEDLIWVRNAQFGMGCHGEPTSEDAVGRWFYLTPGGSSPFFETREQAQQWRQDQRDKHRNTLPSARPLGYHRGSNNGLFDIEYSDIESPVDEVRVLADTVAVRDGVLRGLVRNWSRTLWAYRVIVTGGGKSWQWPLSIQPGEVAPFELEDWHGPHDPEHVGLAVEAHMSPKADLSRSYLWGGTSHQLSIEQAEQYERDWGYEPGIVALISASRFSYLGARFVAPTSHPSFADRIDDPELGFTGAELRGYVAYLRTSPQGRATVFHVVDQPISASADGMTIYSDLLESNHVDALLWSGLPNPYAR